MPENPYATPQAQSAQSAPPLAKAPDTITRKIAVGCIVAWLSAAISLIFAIMQFANGSVGGGILFSVDVVLIGVCAYGLHRHSRIAALLLVVYCILARLILLASGNLNGMVLGVIILLVYLSAARGTFQYHRWLQQERRFPSSQRPRVSDDPLFRTRPPESTTAEAAITDVPVPPAH
ncbi:hypothetical protein ACQHIH_06390 [Xanthomonas sontii]|uniref:hypothetical protein n=1 Tax=Xanthomonas sontii TaxID=2650745 RepID=UPI003D39F6E4